MQEIFISYRRDDGPEISQLVAEHLKKNFGEQSVFLDTSRLALGEKFSSELEAAVVNAKVVIAMIGPSWRGKDPKKDRLFESGDWVRKELEFALAKKIPKIFPVFVDGGTADKSFKNLPESLKGISSFNATSLRKLEFERDILPLIAQISIDLNLDNPLKDHPFEEGKYKLPLLPFKGMDYFKEKDARIFFGRGIEIRRLINNLVNAETQILLFFGYSGVGKSSMLFAGLKPRMEYKGWRVFYFRREKDRDFKEVLKKTEGVQGHQLVILDQLEEIFTSPKEDGLFETEKRELIKLVNELIKNKDRKVFLSFRKEYLAEIKALFKGQVMEEEFLEALSSKGILEAVEGLNQSESSRDIYRLEYEVKEDGQKLITVIAQIILGDSAGNKAPLLQLILRKMWDKVSDNKPRKFTFNLFEEIKSENLPMFVKEQLESLQEKFKDELDSGMILELLFYFTTSRGTSAQHSIQEVQQNFLNSTVRQILEGLKNIYLITEISPEDGSEIYVFRLAHDSLAPIIREMHELSNLPAQRAAGILSSKKKDIVHQKNVEFSKADLKILEAGKPGMRSWTDLEEVVIKENLERVSKEEKELEEAYLEVKIQLARYYWEQAKQAKEKQDYTKYLLIAGKALELSNNQVFNTLLLFNAQSFIPDYKVGIQFSHNSEVFGAMFNANGSRILTWSRDDKSARIWDSSTGEQLNKPMEHDNGVYGAIYNHDESRILTWSRFGIARIWDSNSGIQTGKPMDPDDRIYGAKFNCDGSKILTWVSNGGVRIWDSRTGELAGNSIAHGDTLNGAIFNWDGTRVLTWGVDKRAKIWNSRTGEQSGNSMEHEAEVLGAMFNADESRIMTWSSDGSAKIWDSSNGKQLGKSIKHGDKVEGAIFDSNEGRFLTWSSDGTAKIWDSRTGNQLGKPMEHGAKVNGAIFNSDESLILTWSSDGTAKIWDSRTGEQSGKSMVHGTSVYGAMFNATETRILTWSGLDEKVRIWDSRTGEQSGNSMEHGEGVLGAMYNTNENRILTWSGNGRVRVWDSNIGEQFSKSLKHGGVVKGAMYDTKGARVLTWGGARTVRIWNSRTGEQSGKSIEHEAEVEGAIFNAERTCILSWGSDGAAKFWDTRTGEQLAKSMEHEGSINGAIFNSDESLILTWSSDRTVRIWESWTGEQIGKSMKHGVPVHGAMFNGDESRVLSWSNFDDKVRIWNSISGEQSGKSLDNGAGIKGAMKNAEGNLILTWGSNGRVRIWNSNTEEQPYKNLDQSGPVDGAMFNADGGLILTWSSDGSARIWDSSTGKQLRKTMDHGPGTSVDKAIFNGDESRVLSWSNNGRVRIWDSSTGEQAGKSMEHGAGVNGAMYNTDESRILTWSRDGTARIWDSSTGEQSNKSMEHEVEVLGAMFNADESRVLTWSSDGTAKIWDIEADLDFPAEHFSLQLEVLTGISMKMNSFEVYALEIEEWKSKKAQYEKLAREHYKVCKHPKANWWAKFNPEEAKILRPDVE